MIHGLNPESTEDARVVVQRGVRCASSGAALVQEDDAVALRVVVAPHDRRAAAAGTAVHDDDRLGRRIALVSHRERDIDGGEGLHTLPCGLPHSSKYSECTSDTLSVPELKGSMGGYRKSSALGGASSLSDAQLDEAVASKASKPQQEELHQLEHAHTASGRQEPAERSATAAGSSSGRPRASRRPDSLVLVSRYTLVKIANDERGSPSRDRAQEAVYTHHAHHQVSRERSKDAEDASPR